MAAAAFAAGYSVLGFSSHAPLPFETVWNMDWTDLPAYAEAIRALQRQYEPLGMDILLGLEIDYIRDLCGPADEAYGSIFPDYSIASVHFVHGLSGEMFAVDEPEADFDLHVKEFASGDVSSVWRQYYHALLAMMDAGGFDIIGHFDLVKKNNRKGRWFDEESKAYLDAAFEAVDRAAELGRIAEINTGGLARGKTDSPYPSRRILSRMHERGLRLTLGDDAHASGHFAVHQAAAIRAAAEAGYRSLWHLDKDREWKEIGIDEAGRPGR
jgi:histidinol-phosphatase (PHP family)